MTKVEALYSFFSSFGIPAYEENSVYAMADNGNAPSFPYLTYEVKTDYFGESDTNISFSLWYRSMSWVDINAKSEEISAAIGRVGKLLDFDGGRILKLSAGLKTRLFTALSNVFLLLLGVYSLYTKNMTRPARTAP